MKKLGRILRITGGVLLVGVSLGGKRNKLLGLMGVGLITAGILEFSPLKFLTQKSLKALRS